MATETVQKYKVSMAFDEAYKKLEKFQRKSSAFNKASEASLKRQVALYNKLKTSIPIKRGTPTPVTSQVTPNKGGMDAHLKAREKHINASVRAEEQRVKALERARRIAMRHNIMLGDTKDLQVQLTRQAIRERIAKAKTADEVRDIVKQQQANLHAMRRTTKEQQKQNFLLRRMKSSSQQIAGNMVSAFAIAAGAAGVTRVGQDFESVRNTMLAVSDSAEQSGENFKFVRNEAFRLGLGLKESAKGFAKMVSARGNMTIEQTKEAFTGLSEMSTLLGLSAEESSRATNALMQMMSKNVVTAEELKLQMAEVLPNSIQIMAKAAQDAGISVSGTVGELFELQQQGKVISDQVLPHFARRMSEAAKLNGGLEKALMSNRVAMNRFTFSIQESADIFFNSGFGEGLTEFFNTTARSIVELAPLWKGLGKIIGSALKAISLGVKIITPVLSAFGTILKYITDVLGDFSVLISPAFAPFLTGSLFMALTKVSKAAGGVATMFKSMFTWAMRTLLPLVLIVGALEELANYYGDGSKKGVLPSRKDNEANLDKFTKENPAFAPLKDMGSYGFMDAIKSLGKIFTYRVDLDKYRTELQQPINVNVNLDSDILAEKVINKPIFKESMESELHPYLTGGRY